MNKYQQTLNRPNCGKKHVFCLHLNANKRTRDGNRIDLWIFTRPNSGPGVARSKHVIINKLWPPPQPEQAAQTCPIAQKPVQTIICELAKNSHQDQKTKADTLKDKYSTGTSTSLLPRQLHFSSICNLSHYFALRAQKDRGKRDKNVVLQPPTFFNNASSSDGGGGRGGVEYMSAWKGARKNTV